MINTNHYNIHTVKSKKEKVVNKQYNLSAKELYCMKLMLNCNDLISISELLKIKISEVLKVKYSIKKKLNCKSWNKTILKAFKLNLIDKNDYVHPIVLNVANNKAERIVETFENKIHLKQLKRELIDFFEVCEHQFNKQYVIELSNMQEQYLQLKFKGLSFSVINENMPLRESLTATLQIFRIFKVDNWFHCFKKAFEINVIKANDLLELEKEIEAMLTAQLIKTCLENQNTSLKYKQQLIFKYLIAFYNTVEYRFLYNTLD